MKTINVSEDGGYLVVDKSEFIESTSGEAISSIIVNSNSLRVPLILFKTGENSYEAYSLRCTHKGVKLDYVNDRFECSAHGSVFDRHGKVVKGPAKSDLERYETGGTATTIRIKI
jgi:Rieske Fe-S protein